jgi:predicted GTPase
MIVLDEELQGLGLEEAIAKWYRGSVSVVKQLRPGTVIKDEAIPTLLRRVDQTTFVTINHTDFWRRIPAERAFCLVCFRLSADQAQEIPDLLRRLLRLPEFRTKRERMGKVALISRRGIQYYYSHRDKLIHILGWGQ